MRMDHLEFSKKYYEEIMKVDEKDYDILHNYYLLITYILSSNTNIFNDQTDDKTKKLRLTYNEKLLRILEYLIESELGIVVIYESNNLEIDIFKDTGIVKSKHNDWFITVDYDSNRIRMKDMLNKTITDMMNSSYNIHANVFGFETYMNVYSMNVLLDKGDIEIDNDNSMIRFYSNIKAEINNGPMVIQFNDRDTILNISKFVLKIFLK